MAASIKMDELLVQWLGSDTVYENVLNLVETLRKEESIDDNNNINSGTSNNINSGSSPNNTNNNANGLESPPSPPRPHGNDNNNATAEFTIHEKVPIPPFYRPPGKYHNGVKMKSIRRNRSNSFDSDQSWDGIYSVDSTTFSESNSEAEFATEPSSSTNNNPEDSNTPTTAAATSSKTKSDVPIKEQVQQIFEEHGKSFAQRQQQHSSMNNYNQQSQSKYLTIDNFVKITKDICNFPTFFNKPLYKRILYLWNTQDIKSDSGKLILWNEFYLSTEELDIGIDHDEEESNSNDKDENNENNDKEKKKRKSNELLDQLDKFITYDIFKWYWTYEMEDYDLSERFYRLLKKPHEDYISKDDFGPFIKELLNDHPVSTIYITIIRLIRHAWFKSLTDQNVLCFFFIMLYRDLNSFPTMLNFKINMLSQSSHVSSTQSTNVTPDVSHHVKSVDQTYFLPSNKLTKKKISTK